MRIVGFILRLCLIWQIRKNNFLALILSSVVFYGLETTTSFSQDDILMNPSECIAISHESNGNWCHSAFTSIPYGVYYEITFKNSCGSEVKIYWRDNRRGWSSNMQADELAKKIRKREIRYGQSYSAEVKCAGIDDEFLGLLRVEFCADYTKRKLRTVSRCMKSQKNASRWLKYRD